MLLITFIQEDVLLLPLRGGSQYFLVLSRGHLRWYEKSKLSIFNLFILDSCGYAWGLLQTCPIWPLSLSTTWGQGGFHYHRLHIEHVNPSPGGLEAEPKGGRSLNRYASTVGWRSWIRWVKGLFSHFSVFEYDSVHVCHLMWTVNCLFSLVLSHYPWQHRWVQIITPDLEVLKVLTKSEVHIK